jgi:hypothetical protein
MYTADGFGGNRGGGNGNGNGSRRSRRNANGGIGKLSGGEAAQSNRLRRKAVRQLIPSWYNTNDTY